MTRLNIAVGLMVVIQVLFLFQISDYLLNGIMKLSFKMYIVMIIGIFIIAYQYHLSNAWLISNTPQVKDINVDNRPEVVTSIKSPNTKDDAKIIKSTTLPNVDKVSILPYLNTLSFTHF